MTPDDEESLDTKHGAFFREEVLRSIATHTAVTDSTLLETTSFVFVSLIYILLGMGVPADVLLTTIKTSDPAIVHEAPEGLQ